MDSERRFQSGHSVQKEPLTSESTAKADYSHTAPEVYYDEPDLQSVARNTEPEVYYGESSPQPIHLKPTLKAYEKDSDVKFYDVQLNQQHPKSVSTKRRRLCLLSAIVALLALLAIGLGLGLGLGLPRSQHHTDNNISASPVTSTTALNPSISSSSPTASATPTDLTSLPSDTASSPSSASSTAPVTTGTTGVATNDCWSSSSGTYLTNKNPTKFTFDCGVDYPRGEYAFNSTSNIVQDIPIRLISYTFEDCIEQCAIYNAQNPSAAACNAISYDANLTSSVGLHNRNCVIKTLRGKQVIQDTAHQNIIASAYITPK